VSESDRRQVLDAVIDYGGELVVVVENKVADADTRQARELNVTGARVRIAEGQEAVVVLWRDVLDAVISLRESGLVAGAEAAVVDDFLTYTEDHFPALGPFRTLGLAAGNRLRQTRRLRQLLAEVTGRQVTTDWFGAYVPNFAADTVGANAYLHVSEDGQRIALSLFPADTLGQARAFYGDPANVAAFTELRSQPGWEAHPHFHFGHMQRGYCWTCNDIALEDYIALWTERIADTTNVPREEWAAYWAWLESVDIACPSDRREFDKHFTDTQRQSATPRPGLSLSRIWSLDEAEALDARGALHDQVAAALHATQQAFGINQPAPSA
jgi:hypothetical protein